MLKLFKKISQRTSLLTAAHYKPWTNGKLWSIKQSSKLGLVMSLCSASRCPLNLHHQAHETVSICAYPLYNTYFVPCAGTGMPGTGLDRHLLVSGSRRSRRKNFALPLPFSSTDGKIQSNPNPIVCSDQKPLSWNEVHKLSLRTNDMRKRECVLTGWYNGKLGSKRLPLIL